LEQQLRITPENFYNKGATMTTWILKIREPSGESKSFPLKNEVTLGRGQNSDIILKDPTLHSEAAVLTRAGNDKNVPFWIKIPSTSPAASLADISVREAQIPVGMPFKLGETVCSIEIPEKSQSLPTFPSGIRPWYTQSDEGARLLWTCKKTASTPLSVYIGGETGTGKEVIAHLIHGWSDRRSGPFVPLHCAALPTSLAESELFGHTKGAFTGAIQNRPGALMQAHGGTLFLDEIGDLPLDIQVKLLRFLENGEIRALGADRASRVDVRLICATHLPLLKLVEEGKFRRDLYYRLASVSVEIPSLRSRPEDVELLSKRFTKDLNRSLSPRALFRLQAHSWPGNVRELQHAIERATSLSSIFSTTLSEDAFEFLLTATHITQNPDIEFGTSALSLNEMERIMLLKALKLCHGNRAHSAKVLGVARSTLFEMLKRHKIAGPRSQARLAS
jgi:DNA-binding NtrC family response regulator